MSSTSSTPHVRHITNPIDAELTKLVDIFVEAFRDDPFCKVIFGADPSLIRAQRRAHLRAALISGGAVHAVAVGPRAEDLRGAAIWYPPGTSALTSAEARAAGWDQFIARLPKALRAWWLDCFSPTMKKLSTDALGVGGAHHAWHLLLFGVLPAHQGRGYGRMLVEHVERLASETRTPLVVETGTETSVDIYTKLGFDVVRDIDIPSDCGKAHVWLLVKKLQQVASMLINPCDGTHN